MCDLTFWLGLEGEQLADEQWHQDFAELCNLLCPTTEDEVEG